MIMRVKKFTTFSISLSWMITYVYPFVCLCISDQVHAAYFIICYFQGGKIRPKLVAELSGVKDVVIEEGTAGEGGKAAAQNGMRK